MQYKFSAYISRVFFCNLRRNLLSVLCGLFFFCLNTPSLHYLLQNEEVLRQIHTYTGLITCTNTLRLTFTLLGAPAQHIYNNLHAHYTSVGLVFLVEGVRCTCTLTASFLEYIAFQYLFSIIYYNELKIFQLFFC